MRAGETGTVLDWSLHFTYAAYSCGAELVLQFQTFTEECSGTGTGAGNGFVDPGEDITVQAVLLNNGSVETQQVWGALSTTSPWVTITRSTATFPDIPPGAQGASNPDHFAFRVDPSAPCGQALPLNLHMVSWEKPMGWDDNFAVTVGEVAPGPPEYLLNEDCEDFVYGWPMGTEWAAEAFSGTPWHKSWDSVCNAGDALMNTGGSCS